MTERNRNEIISLVKGRSFAASKKILCGDYIGSGTFRDVYVLKQNHLYVVKIERDVSMAYFANVTEWRHYVDNMYYPYLSKWLAPCEFINETGTILVQKRVTHGRRKDYPKYVPYPFTDLKIKNFGWIGDDFVCCDYSYLRGYDRRKMRYAKW